MEFNKKQFKKKFLGSAVSVLSLFHPVISIGPVGLGVAVSTVHLFDGKAVAQDASDIAVTAKAITVRIESATQGSGVIVKREGNTYTVLTAWHVVSGNRPGEELAITTPDGKNHQLEQGTIQRLGKVDMAVLNFKTPDPYQVATIGNIKDVNSGNPIFVAGFPLPTSSVPVSIWRFLQGNVIANATVAIPDGYQLLYSNPTLPGMSGGSVLNSQGLLVGIHGRSERDDLVSMNTGKAVSTGTNQAIPISYYRQFNAGQKVTALTSEAKSADDYLAKARFYLDQEGGELSVIKFASKALSIERSNNAYLFRAYAKHSLKDYRGSLNDYNLGLPAIKTGSYVDHYIKVALLDRGIVKSELGDDQGAILDYSKLIQIDPKSYNAYFNRANSRRNLMDHQGAIIDFTTAISINPNISDAYNSRGSSRSDLKDYRQSIIDFNTAISINPQSHMAYSNRGLSKFRLNDYQGAIADYSMAIKVSPKFANAYSLRGTLKRSLSDYQGAITDYNMAISLDPLDASYYYNRALVKYDLGDPDGEVNDYSKAIKIDPNFALAYMNRGIGKISRGDLMGACKDWRKASDLGAQNSVILLRENCQ